MLKTFIELALLVLTLAGCDLRTISTPAATADPQWQRIEAGLHWRILTPNDDASAQMAVVRIDPQRFRFQALYRPGDALSLADWRAQAPDASLIINANFFDDSERVLGLLVSDGQAHGPAYRQRGGSFLVRGEEAAVIANRGAALPTNLDQAVQGFPLLVDSGAPAYFDSRGAERNRRTVIAQDSRGNILIMVAPYFGLSLAKLSAYLTSVDLGIVTAFNLDGGGSTMLTLPGADYRQPSFDAVPAVLAVFPR